MGNIYIIDKKSDLEIQKESFADIEIPDDMDNDDEEEINNKKFAKGGNAKVSLYLIQLNFN